MIVSRDLDCTSTLYIQFSFKFITKGTAKLTFYSYIFVNNTLKSYEYNSTSFWVSLGVPERSHSVLLQYSVNGGISWLLLDEFYFPASTDTLFLHLPLPASAQTNATRFRLWQPYNSGEYETTTFMLRFLSSILQLLFSHLLSHSESQIFRVSA